MNTTDPTSKSGFRGGVWFAIAGTFLFASKSILAKWVYSLGGDASELLTLRMAYAVPAYAIIGWRSVQGSNPISFSRVIQAGLLGFLGYYLAAYLDLLGLHYVSAQLERLTLFTYPALTAALAWWLLGESFNWRTVASIILCFVGIALMYSREVKISNESDHTLFGVLMVMGAAVSYSLYVILGKPMMQRIGSSAFTSIAMLGSSFFVAIHFGLTRSWSDLIELDYRIHVYAIVLALGCTVLPSYLINAAIVRIGASRTSIIGTAGPVLTMILAIVILDEPSTPWHFMGMALAIIGVSIISSNPRSDDTRDGVGD